MNHAETKSTNEAVDNKGEYEAPRIELVVTGEDLEREVHYAGAPSQIA